MKKEHNMKRSYQAHDLETILRIYEKIVNSCSEALRMIVNPPITTHKLSKMNLKDFEGLVRPESGCGGVIFTDKPE